MKSVCKDCNERYPACWGSCSKYLKEKAKHDEELQAKNKAALMNQALNHVQYFGLTKSEKRKGKKL